MRFLFIFIFLVNFIAQSQVSGFILDDVTNEPIIGAKIYCSDGNRSISGFDGDFKLKSNTFPVTLRISMLEYINDTIIVKEAGEYTIKMKQPSIDLETVVISAGRRKQVIENVPVSMEIIRPQLIDNKGISQLDDAVDQSPGVFTMDGQVSIRGGSGYSYGAGSRVLLLWNGMPLLSGYAGDTQWNAIPIEQAAQVEIMKGASSVLYGSGALNGVIAITEKQPVSKPETKIKLQSGIYGNPKRESLKWWSRNPTFHQFELYKPLLQYYDISIYPSADARTSYEKYSKNSYYMPFAADPKSYRSSINKALEHYSFIGTAYGNRPYYIWRLLQSGVELKIFGPNWSLGGWAQPAWALEGLPPWI